MASLFLLGGRRGRSRLDLDLLVSVVRELVLPHRPLLVEKLLARRRRGRQRRRVGGNLLVVAPKIRRLALAGRQLLAPQVGAARPTLERLHKHHVVGQTVLVSFSASVLESSGPTWPTRKSQLAKQNQLGS